MHVKLPGMPTPDPYHRIDSRPDLILASTSAYRKQLLARLGLPFQTFNPGIDERRRSGESGAQSVERLARAKAQAVDQALAAQDNSDHRPQRLIIASDQLSILADKVLGKPGSYAAAHRQLTQSKGRCVEFVTGIAVLNSAARKLTSRVIHNRVWFKDLSSDQIEAYLKVEKPFDCAGSFKSEGLGIALFHRLEGDDPNALIGLPLIALCDLLLAQGLDVLTTAAQQ